MDHIASPFHFGQENFQIIAPEYLIPTIEAAIRSMVPHARFGSGRVLNVNATWELPNKKGTLEVYVALAEKEGWYYLDQEIKSSRYNLKDRERRVKERVRLGLLRVFEEAYDLSPSPWGILTGVRPTKLVHSFFDRGFTQDEVSSLLQDVYAVTLDKIGLLLDVVEKQQRYFHPDPNKPVSVYLGIPFCPTRCGYCSFAAYPLETHGHLLKGFLNALRVEIKVIGSLFRELGVEVETIYLGGGTPTTVQGAELSELLALIREYLVTEETVEFTVEAGRPETLSLNTLNILKKAAVDRISINPQTMHDSTLQAIGRKHSVEQVHTAFELARQVGISQINMDIILGLPGEKPSHVEATLLEISSLKPDNLTVHSLALKRAAPLRRVLEEVQAKQVQVAQQQGETMANYARDFAISWGMKPYYLYRQRYISGGLENIGYAKPGLESIYNVQMMEERQTIIALGGGGISKLVSSDLSLVRLINPKCPATYSQQIKNNLKAKINQIRKHLLV